MRLKDINKTKHTHHRPWCGDDASALGWGIIKPQAMVGAKTACHHGDIVIGHGIDGILVPVKMVRLAKS